MARPAGTDSTATRARILEEACQHLIEAGAVDFSARTVARSAGVSISVVYHYFGDREALINACIDTAYDDLRKSADELRDKLHDPAGLEDVWAKTATEGFRFAREHRELVRALNLLVFSKGRLDVGRRRTTEIPFLASAADLLAMTSGLERVEARLRLRSMIALVARYAISDLSELRELTGAADDAATLAAIESHLAATARALLG